MNRTCKERGVTSLEAAMLLPVFLFTVYAILEVGRMFTYRAVLNAGAQRALSLASVIPDLDSEDETQRAAALTRIRTQGLELPLATFFSEGVGQAGVSNVITEPVEIDYTQPDVGESREQVLMENPITVRIRGEVEPIFGGLVFGGRITLRGEARGYREPRNTFSEPIPLDCAGNPLPANGDGNTSQCACPSNPNDPSIYFDPATSQCRCRNSNLVFNPDSNSCECPPDYRIDSGDGGDGGDGGDSAPDSSATCVCDLTGGTCAGRSDPVWPGNPLFFQAASCSCQVCWAPRTVQDGGTSCRCGDPGTGSTPSIATCVSQNSMFDSQGLCDCKSCGAIGEGTPNAAGTGCDCNESNPCPNNQRRIAWGNCQCACDGALTIPAPNGQPSCAPNTCATQPCTWDPDANQWVVGE